MELTPEAVRKLALLSRLSLDEAEIPQVIEQLRPILDHLDELASLDLEAVPPMMHPDSSPRPLRPDEPHQSLPNEVALANAPKAVEGFFAIPKVIGAG